MLSELDPSDRLQLMKFVCSFAWADLEIHRKERAFILELVRRLEFDPDDSRKIARWLEVPPQPEEVDPTTIPDEHRRVFLRSIEGLIEADGVVSQGEIDSLDLFRSLLDNPHAED